MSAGIVILIVFIVIIVLAGIGVGLYFILRNEKKNEGGTGATGATGTTLNYPALVSAQLPPDVVPNGTSNCCAGCGYNRNLSDPNPIDKFTYSFDPMYDALAKSKGVSVTSGFTGATGATGINPNSNINISSIDVNLKGSHYYDCGDGSKVVLDIYDTNGIIIKTFVYDDPVEKYISATSDVKIIGTLTNPPPLSKYVLTLTTSTGNGCCYYSFLLNLNFIVTFPK